MKKIFLAPRAPRLKTNQVESDMRGGQALLQQHQLIRPFSAAIANKVINIENADAFCSCGDVCGERRHQHEIFNLFTKKKNNKKNTHTQKKRTIFFLLLWFMIFGITAFFLPTAREELQKRADVQKHDHL